MKARWRALGKYLKQTRKKAGLTQTDVAKEFGYTSPQFISNYERGLCAPSVETLGFLCELIGADKEFVIKELLRIEEKRLRENMYVRAV